MIFIRAISVLTLNACCLLMLSASVAAEEPIDFTRQVRPILADRCFHCHGPDAKNQDSDFRLDSQENIFADLGGYFAVAPGDLKASELHTRIHSDDELTKMPPPDSNRKLSAKEKQILDLWIEQGAKYERHWAFTLPKRAEPAKQLIDQGPWPADVKQRWSTNPIDIFLAKRLLESKVAPAPIADPATQLRRASLTLTGLLPPQQLQDDFLSNPSDQAYGEAVDELLSSIDFAERQSLRWLDAARYADTDGYQNDSGRTNWPWRDWVTDAIDRNMPFDQFTIEQLAGDMLPNATESQRLATAFNRNHRQNAEGGALAAEFLIENVIDRVETTSTVWMGLTMGCCRCHDHKYDPISQEEFYQFYGYFNNIGERGIGRGTQANPVMKAKSPLAAVDPAVLAVRDKARQDLKAVEADVDVRMQKWFAANRETLAKASSWAPVSIKQAELQGAGELKQLADGVLRYSPVGQAKNQVYEIDLQIAAGSLSGFRIEALVDAKFTPPRRLASSVNGNFVLTDVQIRLNGETQPIKSAKATFEQTNYPLSAAIDAKPDTGWAVFGPQIKAEPVTAIFALAKPVAVAADDRVQLTLRFESNFANHAIGKFRLSVTDKVPPQFESAPTLPAELASKTFAELSDSERQTLRTYYQTIDTAITAAKQKLTTAEAAVRKLQGPEATVMIMQEKAGPATPIYKLDRGQYDAPLKDKPLTRGAPKAILVNASATQPADRLELARWLVSRDNPLTARVIVNRIWQEHFGVGLVKTANDFGLQGETPSHPQLLDWLAVEFIESGWDVKAMHRLIVTSAAYRQSSVFRPSLREIDPENRLYARGPRFRADGFAIRDMALQASGLLNREVGGPPVKPYQPAGLWRSVASNANTKYTPSTGNALFRKSMYTYWKRAVNPPRQTIFDAGGREVCNVVAVRTNTPLQALVLMNDPTFLESARQLAKRGLTSKAKTDRDRLAVVYQLAIGRPADEQTLTILNKSLAHFTTHFSNNAEDADQWLSVGQSPPDKSIDRVEHAAMTAVAHVILNLDEFVTIE